MRVFNIFFFFSFYFSSNGLLINFSKEPRDVIVAPGKTAAFHCVPSPDTTASVEAIQWFRGEKLLRVDSRRKQLANGTLVISNVGRTDGTGRYRCVLRLLRNFGAVVSREATLQVAYLAPHFDMEPRATSARLGDSVSFMCRIKSAPHPPTIHWLFAKRAELLPIPLTPTSGRYAMLNGGQVLELPRLTTDQLGLYYCQATLPPRQFGDQGRTTSSKAALTLAEARAAVPLSFGLHPSTSLAVLEGSTAELLCSANGRAPVGDKVRPTMTWLFGALAMNIRSMPRHSRVGSGSLRITNVKAEDAGTYTCRASLAGSDDVFSTSNLRVLTKPSFNQLPPASVRGFFQQELRLPCRVQGAPEPKVTWRKNGALVNDSEYFQLEGQSLRIIGLLTSDSALYQCIGTNAAGNVHAAVRLIVQQRPTQASTPTGEPLTPPGKPLALKTMVVGPDYVNLEWQPPGDIAPADRTKSGQLSYDVIWRKRGHERVRQLNTTHIGYVIPGLSPGTIYDVEVYAVLSPAPGISIRSLHPARLQCRTHRPVATPVPVRDLKAEAKSATEIRVRWRNPQDVAKYVQHYKVLLFNASDSLTKQRIPQNFTMRPQNPTPGAETAFQITNLHPYALYRLLVFGVNASGRGHAMEASVRTLEAKPNVSPQNVTVQVSGSRSVTVRWAPLTSVQRNGEIVAYKIRYKRLDAAGQALGKAKAIPVSGAKTGFTITKLERNSPYMVKISARTAVGAGPFSPWVKFRTMASDPDAEFEDRPPGPVEGLDARGLPNAIVLSWFRPDRGRTQVTKYTVHWGEIHDDENRRDLDGSRLEFTIRGLKPSRTYYVRIDPFNKHGLGKAVYKEVHTRDKPEFWSPDDDSLPIPMTLRATLTEATTALLSWEDPEGPDASRRDGRRYELRYYPTSGLDRVNPSRSALGGAGAVDGDLGDGAPPPGSIAVNATSTRVRVGGLRPNTRYEFKVRTVKRASNGNRRWSKSVWSFVQKFTTREDKPSSPPQELTLTSVPREPRSVKLAWQPPARPNGQIRNYVVYFSADRRVPKQDWVQRSVKGSVLNLKVTSLDRDVIYFFQIRARNRKGAGPFSPIRLYKTADDKGMNGGPLRLPSDVYEIHRIPQESTLLANYFNAGRDSAKRTPGEGNVGMGSGLGDNTWWIIIGCVFGFAILLIVVILVFICVCRPSANARLLVRKRNSEGYKLGSKVPDVDGTGLVEPHGKVTPLPPPSLKPPDLFTGHRAPGGDHQHYEMERRDSESGSDSVRYQGGQQQVPNGGLIGPHGHVGRSHVRIGSQGQPIKPKPMLLPVQDAMQPPPREPVAMVTAIGGPGMGRGLVQGPNGVIAGPTPFMRGQFAMAGPAGPPVGAVPVPGPRVNASDIASQPSSEELQPLMSSSQISQPGLSSPPQQHHQRQQSPRYSEYTSYSPATTVVYDTSTVKSSGSEKSSGTDASGGVVRIGGRRLATSPSGNAGFYPTQQQQQLAMMRAVNQQQQQQQKHVVMMHQKTPIVAHIAPHSHSNGVLAQNATSKNGSPYHGSNSSAKNGPKNLRSAPVLAEGNDSASEISRGYSTEKLNQEMLNLEGLMKDLNAMTQKEFEC